MTTEATTGELRIQRESVARYIFQRDVLILLVVSLMTLGIGLVLLVVYGAGFGQRWSRRRSDALRYRIVDDVLEVEAGVWYLVRKSVRIANVRDVMLSQGPLMRRFGLWSVSVYTSGQGGMQADAQMDGLVDPEGARQLLLTIAEKTNARTADKSL